jgi:lambda repressor-like predicted transcriptional regulator
VGHQNISSHHQYPGHYLHDYLVRLMRQQGLTPRDVAEKAQLSKTTIAEALVGECKKFETLWVINKALGGTWGKLFKLPPEPYQDSRAVLAGEPDSVR